MCHSQKKELIPIFTAVAALAICALIIFDVVSFREDRSNEARLWAAVAVGLVALLLLLGVFARTWRGMASVERATAALRQKETSLHETERRFHAVCDNASWWGRGWSMPTAISQN